MNRVLRLQHVSTGSHASSLEPQHNGVAEGLPQQQQQRAFLCAEEPMTIAMTDAMDL